MLNACDACEHHAVPQVRSLNRTVGTLCPRGTHRRVTALFTTHAALRQRLRKHPASACIDHVFLGLNCTIASPAAVVFGTGLNACP